MIEGRGWLRKNVREPLRSSPIYKYLHYSHWALETKSCLLFPPNSYIEALTSHGTIFGDRAFREVIKFK